jgi:ATP-dependent DNA helicase RecQ
MSVMSDLAAAQRTLRTTFGFEAFRPGQAEIVSAILDGRDVLAVMPTGSGKSLCYQLPALLRDGLTIVVSPLIALMRNQVAQLRGYGIAAAALNSANDPAESRAMLDGIARGDLRLVYVAPERLVRSDTLDLLKRARNMRRSAPCRRHLAAYKPSHSLRLPMLPREPTF